MKGSKEYMKKNESEQIKKIIEGSGNNFHSKVVNSLRERDWTVLISPYYNDNISDKPREIDVIAEKAFDVKNGWGEWQGTINIKMLIECKYINQNIVFWFDDKDKHKAKDLIVHSTPLRKNYPSINQHHYLTEDNDTVAKLFASEKKQRLDSEIIYKALNQSLNALVDYRDSISIIPRRGNEIQKRLAPINYPVIICNNFSRFYGVDISTDKKAVKIKENFQLEVNYAYIDKDKTNKNEYFLIDIVDFRKIDDYLKTLENDSDIISMILRD